MARGETREPSQALVKASAGLAVGFVIREEGGLTVGARHRLQIGEAIKKIKAYFKPLEVKLDEAKEEVLQKKKDLLNPLLAADASIKEEMQRYLNARREEGERLEAERRQRQAEYEAKLAKAKRPERIKEPEEIEVPEAPRVPGMTQTVEWRYEITNPELLPRCFLIPDKFAIAAEVRESKGDTEIPGVRVWSEIIVGRRG